jgi:hypothetical protein
MQGFHSSSQLDNQMVLWIPIQGFNGNGNSQQDGRMVLVQGFHGNSQWNNRMVL